MLARLRSDVGQVLRVFNIRFGLAAVTSLDPVGNTAWMAASLVVLAEGDK